MARPTQPIHGQKRGTCAGDQAAMISEIFPDQTISLQTAQPLKNKKPPRISISSPDRPITRWISVSSSSMRGGGLKVTMSPHSEVPLQQVTRQRPLRPKAVLFTANTSMVGCMKPAGTKLASATPIRSSNTRPGVYHGKPLSQCRGVIGHVFLSPPCCIVNKG